MLGDSFGSLVIKYRSKETLSIILRLGARVNYIFYLRAFIPHNSIIRLTLYKNFFLNSYTKLSSISTPLFHLGKLGDFCER